MKTIAIQGIKGSFHHQVAQEYFGQDNNFHECLSFDILISSVLQGKSDTAVMAIGNSIAGTILPNYGLIDTNNLYIVGEHYINISMNLMAVDGQSIEDISEVASHPIALLQCKDFFQKHPHIKLVEDNDTADVARRISEQNIKGLGAIASPIASELYNLNVVASDIHTIKMNQTRFLILSKESNTIRDEENDTKRLLRASQLNKASFKLTVGHHQGALATALNVLSDCQLNLTKIQSVPIVEQPWNFYMFVEVTFDSVENYKKAIDVLKVMIEDVKVLGVYKNGLE